MALRTTTLAAGTRRDSRTQEEWRAVIQQTLESVHVLVSTGRQEELKTLFARMNDWSDPQRAYQGRRAVAELIFTGSDQLKENEWLPLYATAAESLLDALERQPLEPLLLNYAGVLLYELTALSGAEALFRAAERLDPAVPHLKANLRSVRQRKRSKQVAKVRGPLAGHVRALGARAQRIAALAKPEQGLTLSLCMIVKDEEEMLPGCLEAVHEHVDEIVIVDTGSTDRTVEIAESFGAKVVHFPWNGSFADARNVSIEHATGDWLVYLDADEHLMPEDAPKLRQLLTRTWREAFYLVETNYTGGEDSGSAVTHLALRLWRNRPEYRFEGRIHEQKTHNMPNYLPERFEPTQIRMRHFGYLKSRISARDKSRRNIELLELEAKEGVTPFNRFNLGSEYLALGDAPRARKLLDEAWEGVRKEADWQLIGYVPLLATRVAKARREAGDYAAARKAHEETLAVFPQNTDLVFEQALCAREEGKLAEAEELVRRCLEMGDADARFSGTVGAGSFLALCLLGELRAAAGAAEEAEQLYRRSLVEFPEYHAPVLPLAASLLARGVSPAEVEAELPVERASSLLLYATACYEAGHAEAAEGHFRAVIDKQPANGAARIGLVESLLSQSRYLDAADEAALEAEGSPVAAVAALEELFALAAAGETARLGEALEKASRAGVHPEQLELYRAWHESLTGAASPRVLSVEAGRTALVALEALLRVQEFESFERVLGFFQLSSVDARAKREWLAQLYMRRGYLESAADEWIAVASTEPDVAAYLGLGQIALAHGEFADAAEFARGALALDGTSVEARRLLTASQSRESLALAS